MDSCYTTGEQYYQELGLEQYGFSEEERHAICEFYDYYHTKKAENSYSSIIVPLSKERSAELMPHMESYLPDVCLLWEDGSNNYAGVYYKGVLSGKIMFLCHEGLRDTPLFRDISSLVQSMKAGLIRCFLNPFLSDSEYNCDYPAKSLSELERTQNFILAKEYLSNIQCKDEELDFQLALKAFYLLPAQNLDLLIPMIKLNNGIAYEAVDVFGFHNYQQVIPFLLDACENWHTNMKNYTKRIIDKMQTR